MKVIKILILILFTIIYQAHSQAKEVDLNNRIKAISKQNISFSNFEITADGRFIILTPYDGNKILIYNIENKAFSRYFEGDIDRYIIDNRNPFKINNLKNELIICYHFYNDNITRFDIYNIENGKKVNHYDIAGEVLSYNISHNGKYLAISSLSKQPKIYILDYNSGNILYEYYGENYTLNFSKDDRYVGLFTEENPLLGGNEIFAIWDFQIDTFSTMLYSNEFHCASFSVDGKTVNLGNFLESGEYSDICYFHQINYIDSKIENKKTIIPHKYYDRIKGKSRIKNIKKFTYLISTNKEQKKIDIRKIKKSFDIEKFDFISFSAGAYDFTNDVRYIVFPAYNEQSKTQDLCYFNIKQNKIEKTIPFQFSNTAFNNAFSNIDSINYEKLKIDALFKIDDYVYDYSSHENSIDNYNRPEFITNFIAIIEGYEKLEGEFDPYYLYKAYSNVEDLYVRTGNYKKADLYLSKMITLSDKYYSDNFPILIDLYYDLSIFHYRINNRNKTLEYTEKYLKLLEKNNCTNTYEYSLGIFSMANTKFRDREYRSADSLLIKSLNLFNKLGYNSGDEYSKRLHLRGDIARLQISKENSQDNNQMLFYKAKNLFSKASYKGWEYSAGLLNSKALLYLKAPYIFKNIDTISYYLEISNEYFFDASESYKYTYGEYHSDYLQSIYNEAISNFISGVFSVNNTEQYYVKSRKLFIQSLNNRISYLYNTISFLSENDATKFLTVEMDNLTNAFLSFASTYKNPDLLAAVYDFSIKTKSLLLKSSTAMRNSILNSGDSTLIIEYNEWIELKQTINKLHATPPETRTQNIEDLSKKADKLEGNLVKNSQMFSEINKLQSISWKEIKDSLKSGEAAIEFMNFTKFDPKVPEFTDSIIYCAVIVTSDCDHPIMIPLFEEKELLSLLNSSRGISLINKLYGKNMQESTALFELVWKPIEKYLDGIKTVYISPSGFLHKVSFPALNKETNIYLCDNYNTNTLSSTAKILEKNNSIINMNVTANIYGGINYNTDSTETEIWSYLDGTQTETQIINFLFEAKKIKTNYYIDSDASESIFKKTSSESNILHLATHGFFYPSKEEEKKDTTKNKFVSRSGSSGFGVDQFVKNKNPLMRSGLVLAGANDVWKKNYSDDKEDGVLTALEVASVDLRKTQLVVLSACETGLGDIRGTEGVYGLQRAFKMAGAKFLIMSLWEVPDMETEEFMTTFYSKLLNLKDIKQAFNQTQKEMRAKYDPYYWAAFVLIE